MKKIYLLLSFVATSYLISAPQQLINPKSLARMAGTQGIIITSKGEIIAQPAKKAGKSAYIAPLTQVQSIELAIAYQQAAREQNAQQDAHMAQAIKTLVLLSQPR